MEVKKKGEEEGRKKIKEGGKIGGKAGDRGREGWTKDAI